MLILIIVTGECARVLIKTARILSWKVLDNLLCVLSPSKQLQRFSTIR